MSNELKTVMEFGQFTADNMSKLRETYMALNIKPDYVRYG